MAGTAAVENAVAGVTDKMVGFERDTRQRTLRLQDEAAAARPRLPTPRRRSRRSGSTPRATASTQDFIDYALPLIQGEPKLPKEDSLPRFAKLKKVLAK